VYEWQHCETQERKQRNKNKYEEGFILNMLGAIIVQCCQRYANSRKFQVVTLKWSISEQKSR